MEDTFSHLLPTAFTNWSYAHWLLVGSILLIIEIVAPVSFFLWIGLAALGVSGLSYVFSLSFSLQWLLFAALALLLMWIGRFYRNEEFQPTFKLNRRADRLIGQSLILDTPIQQGKGRIELGDTSWTIQGPDLPAGTRVVIKDIKGTVLIVEVRK